MRRLAICLALAMAACAPEAAPEPETAEPNAPLPPMTIILRECEPPECAGFSAVRDVEFGAAVLGASMQDKPRGWRRDRLSCDSAMLYESRDLCIYTHGGLIYYFDRELLVGKTLYRVFAPPGMPTWPAGEALPYGLSGDETPEEAARVIEANTGVPMEVSVHFTHAELNSRAPIYTRAGVPIHIRVRYEGSEKMVHISTGLIRPPQPEPNPYLP